MKGICDDPSLELLLLVTGTHLSEEFGLTSRFVEEDGFNIIAKIDINMSSDTPTGITRSMGMAITSFGEAFLSLQPHLVVLLGDRFETLAVAAAAHVCGVPIAHIHGGERSEGAIDEAFRHAITKMAAVHFPAADEYRRRIIQLGEQPNRVFCVGAPGIDSVRALTLLPKEELQRVLGFQFGGRNLLVTFHPVTLERGASQDQFRCLLEALNDLENVTLIFTMPNADPEGRLISEMIEAFVSAKPQSRFAFASMGHRNYLSCMRLVDGVVGNSSSGLIEAPALRVGTINIGDRQKGRLRATSVIDCPPDLIAIRAALQCLFSDTFKKTLPHTRSPYGNGGASEKIVRTIKGLDFSTLGKKSFYDIPFTL